MTRRLVVRTEAWPLAKPFAISRGVKTEANVVVVEVIDGEHRGWGECVPYARYDESVDGVMAELKALSADVTGGLDRLELQGALPPGAARNALDCALWDLEAKASGRSVRDLADLPSAPPTVTAETLGIDTPEAMGRAAEALKSSPLLKVKLDGEQVLERMRAIREGAPEARLIVDPNEGWDLALLKHVAPPLAELGVEMFEQPLPAGDDEGLAEYASPVPVCADEACHTVDGLPALKAKYDMVNIKLDKTGGLTAAMKLAQAADAQGFGIMIGCMVATSLAMAPAVLLAPYARFLDLDGPLLLKEDRDPGLTIENGLIHPPGPELWG